MITNKDIQMNYESLFSHGSSYQQPSLFANREQSTDDMLKEIKSTMGKKVIIISDFLGTGKTFLVNMAYGKIGRPELRKTLSTRRLKDPRDLQKIDLPFIFVDDFDIKTPHKYIKKNLELINDFFSSRSGILVLAGDYTLRNTTMLSLLDNVEDIAKIEMEPLNKEFFLKAMRVRIKRFLQMDEPPDFFDEEFLQYLLPNTSPSVTTFREVFGVLLSVVPFLPKNTRQCFISGREYITFSAQEKRFFLDKNKDRFYSMLIRYIREEYDPEKLMKPMETVDFYENWPIEGINSESDYERQILSPLARIGILRSVGIPFTRKDLELHRFPPPYLPTVETFLRAKYCRGD